MQSNVGRAYGTPCRWECCTTPFCGLHDVWSRTLHGAGRLTDGVCAFASLCWVSSGERPYVVRRCVGSSSELVVRVIGADVIFARCRRLCTLRGLDIECRCRLSRPFFSAHQGCRSRGTSCISSTLCVVLMPVPTSTALKTASPVATRLGNVPRPSAITVYRQAALATGRFHGARCSRVRPIDGLCIPTPGPYMTLRRGWAAVYTVYMYPYY